MPMCSCYQLLIISYWLSVIDYQLLMVCLRLAVFVGSAAAHRRLQHHEHRGGAPETETVCGPDQSRWISVIWLWEPEPEPEPGPVVTLLLITTSEWSDLLLYISTCGGNIVLFTPPHVRDDFSYKLLYRLHEIISFICKLIIIIIEEKQDAGSQINPVTSSLHLKDSFTQKVESGLRSGCDVFSAADCDHSSCRDNWRKLHSFGELFL